MIGMAALGGGLGSALRYAVGTAVPLRWRRGFPSGTFLINVSGSLLLGLLVGTAPDATAVALIGTGVLGGYTTFSTASEETVRLMRSGHPRTALVYASGTMLVTVVAALVGLWLGAHWVASG